MVEKTVNSLCVKNSSKLKKKKALVQGTDKPLPLLFYMQPKIHKEWAKTFEVPPDRPIVFYCNSEIYYTAEYLDHYLNPLSTTVTSRTPMVL